LGSLRDDSVGAYKGVNFDLSIEIRDQLGSDMYILDPWPIVRTRFEVRELDPA
jgi:hypothetical protein